MLQNVMVVGIGSKNAGIHANKKKEKATKEVIVGNVTLSQEPEVLVVSWMTLVILRNAR